LWPVERAVLSFWPRKQITQYTSRTVVTCPVQTAHIV
jgi:hypothetical protein